MLNPHNNAIMTMKLFQMLIMPIVTYGSEVLCPFLGKTLVERSTLNLFVAPSHQCEII